MQEWSTFKAAALEYSRLKPRTVRATLTILAGEDSVATPEGVYAVISTTLPGESLPLDVLFADPTRIGWSTEGAGLIYVNAPVLEDTTFTAVCRAVHLPDEATETFPTIPASDIQYVEMLEQAATLEFEADDTEMGPTKYVIGQSTIERTYNAGGMRGAAAGLRQRAYNALVSYEAEWA